MDSGLLRSMGIRRRLESSSFSMPAEDAKLTSNTPANWLVIKSGANSSIAKPIDAASMKRLPCLWQQAMSRALNRFSILMTLLFCGEALARRIRRLTFADSGRLFAGFLDVCIVHQPFMDCLFRKCIRYAEEPADRS